MVAFTTRHASVAFAHVGIKLIRLLRSQIIKAREQVCLFETSFSQVVSDHVGPKLGLHRVLHLPVIASNPYHKRLPTFFSAVAHILHLPAIRENIVNVRVFFFNFLVKLLTG